MLPPIPTSDRLSELQEYQQAICQARGWHQTSDSDTWLLFTEEVGELAKAIRNRKKLYQETHQEGTQSDLEGEFADVFSYLLELANRMNVDLAAAYRQKEKANRDRNWD